MKAGWQKIGWMLVAVMLLCGCQREISVQQEAIADYAEEKIAISGLTDEEFTVTVAQLASLAVIAEDASSRKANGETLSMQAVGPTLDTFLAQYDKTREDFSKIRFTAADGYVITLSAGVLEQQEMILAVANGEQPLDENEQPLRLVLPGADSMYWERAVCHIDFIAQEERFFCNKIVFLDQAAATLPQQDCDYYGVTDQAVSAGDLLAAFADGETAEQVRITAAGAVSESVPRQDFAAGLLKLSGADAPCFLPAAADAAPITQLALFTWGETGFVALEKVVSLYGQDGGVDFLLLTRLLQVANCETFSFVSGQGETLVLTVEQLADAKIGLDEQGQCLLLQADGQSLFSGVLTVTPEP